MKNNLEKVIITGGAGFIGSNLAEHLFKNGTKEILIIDDFSTGSFKNIEHLENLNIIDSRILILGFTFKENCPDVRNTKINDLRNEFLNMNALVDVYDPEADSEAVSHEYGFKLERNPEYGIYDAVIIAVGHTIFTDKPIEEIRAFGKKEHILYDVKYTFDSNLTDGRL